MSVKHFDKAGLDQAKEQGIVMADFWAEWCQPCQNLLPTIDALAEELDGKATVGKVNVDEQKPLAREYQVMSIPTVIFFKDGVEKERLVGAYPKQKYLDTLASLA